MAEAAGQKRRRFLLIEHNGQRVLFSDFSHAGAQEIEAELPAIQRYITAQPLRSVLSLADWSDADITKDVLAAIKKVAAYDQPHVKRGAIVAGAKAQEWVKALEMFSARNFAIFASREEALEWLTTEKEDEHGIANR